jgi:hypothetical protein
VQGVHGLEGLEAEVAAETLPAGAQGAELGDRHGEVDSSNSTSNTSNTSSAINITSTAAVSRRWHRFVLAKRFTIRSGATQGVGNVTLAMGNKRRLLCVNVSKWHLSFGASHFKMDAFKQCFVERSIF